MSDGVILLCAIVITWVNFNGKQWNKEQGIVKHDIISYYSYLPAALIYKDLSFKFIDDDRAYFHNKIWIFKSPNGGRYQKMTMGLSFLYAPFFLAGHGIAHLTGAEPNGYSIPYMFFLQFSALIYLLLGLVILRKILLRTFSDRITALALFGIVFGTNIFYYTTREAAMPHVYNFFLFSLFMWLTIKWHETYKLHHAVFTGLVFGLIALIRPSNALLALFFIFYDVKSIQEFGQRPLVFIKHWQQILLLIFCAFLVFVPQLVFWKANTGSWFLYSYGDEGFFFSNPQIINGLFSYRKGWLIYTPLMIIALLGILTLARRNSRFFIPVLIFTVANIYVVYSWWCWWYGGSFGSRPMIDSYPLMAVALAGMVAWFQGLQTRKMLPIMGILFFSGLNIFQTLQYQKGAIHFDSMTREAYWESFGKIHPYHEYYDLLEPPNYNAAKKGIQSVAVHSKAIITDSLVCDYDLLTPDNGFFYSTDKRFLLGKPHLRSSEKSRSGEHSLKLTPENQYGSDFQLRAKKGETYILSVWKYPAEVDGRMVFSALKESTFYNVGRLSSEIDSNGWARIETQVYIPDGKQGFLKFYLWNNGSEPLFFDDLQILRIEKP